MKKLIQINPGAAAFFLANGFFPMAGGAVVDAYVNSLLAAGKKAGGLEQAAGNIFAGVETFEVAAADDILSVYRIFKDVNSSLVPLSLRVACDAIAGLTDMDFGLYDSLDRGGAVVDKDCLADGINMSAGYSRILALDALVSVDLANAKKKLWELVSGLTLNTKKGCYDIAMTAVSEPTAAGTVTVMGLFVQG